MPKRANVLPNLRIDIPDYEAQTADFAGDLLKQQMERFLIDNQASVAEGFRVEIADQVTSPRLFTVFNGNAIDRAGQIINNEEDLRDARSLTLGSDATYYIEVQYAETASDTGARGFWDPTYSNGVDSPSGDTLPAGREFNQNVTTRISPSWEIVNPPSTTAFEYTTNPDSTRIPVAVLYVNGAVISGGTLDPLRSVLAEDILLSATSLRLLDTRAMLGSFTLKLDPGGGGEEDVTVTANDRENGVLTLSSGTAGAHSAGTRAVVTGASAATFLSERSDPAIPTSGTEDARPRFFQGDESTGYVLALDPTGSGDDRADVEVKSLKRYVDFLAGQLREMKFGAAQVSAVGTVAPPTTYSTAPRYFDAAGGFLGARAHTVSVGDGSTSWGDFNTANHANAQEAIQAAIDAVPASGGTVYIKAGTYVLTNTTLTLANPINLVGDGIATILQSGGTADVLTITGTDINIRDLQIEYDSGSSTASQLINIGAAAARVKIQDCVLTEDAEVAPALVAATGATDLVLDKCIVSLVQGIGTVADATDLNIFDCKVVFDQDNTALLLSGTTAARVYIRGTSFTQSTTAVSTTGIGIETTATALTRMSIIDCKFTDCDHGISLGAIGGETLIQGCDFRGTVGSRGRTGIRGNNTGGNPNITGVTVDSCAFYGLQDANTSVAAAVYFDESVVGQVSHFTFTNNTARLIGDISNNQDVYGVYIGASVPLVENVTISNNQFRNLKASDRIGGIRLPTTAIESVSIADNAFYAVPGSSPSAGWAVVWIDESGDNVSITGNTIYSPGSTGSLTDAAAIRVGATATIAQYRNLVIGNNKISDISIGSGPVYGILLRGSVDGGTINGNAIESADSDCVAIKIFGAPISSPRMGTISICGNSVTSSGRLQSGIELTLSETTAEIDGRYAIVGNSIANVRSYGIAIGGITAANHTTFVIANNMIFSNSNAAFTGIILQLISYFNCSGNTIRTTNTGTLVHRGIVLSGCKKGAINGNTVIIASDGSAARCIDTNDSGNASIMISGNMVELGNGTATISGNAIHLGDAQYCAVNMARFFVASASGNALLNSGTTDTTTRVIDDAAEGWFINDASDENLPSTYGLNYRWK